MSDIEKATAIESYAESKAIVQAHEFVYDEEVLEGNVMGRSVHLVIYAEGNPEYAQGMKEFLHTLTYGELDFIEQHWEDEQLVTRICVRAPLPQLTPADSEE